MTLLPLAVVIWRIRLEEQALTAVLAGKYRGFRSNPPGFPGAGRTEDLAMTEFGTWVSYSGAARPALAAVLLAAAIALVYAGMRLPLPAGPARQRSRKTVIFMLTAWALAIAATLAGIALYALQAVREHLVHNAASDPIFPVTLIAAAATFSIIAATSPARGRAAFASAAIGAMAGPMVFELPFDLIVMTRVYPPIPPNPALYLALFFTPLFLTEITTLSLLTLSPMVRLSRAAFFSFALMLAVFAGWALTGFGYPSAPVPIAFNVVSKLLAFVTVLALFLPQRARPRKGGPAAGQAQPHASGQAC